MTAYKIIIVEDESISALYLRKTLERSGHMVVGTAANSDSAIEILLSNSDVNLVLMDIKIKGYIDGITLAKRMQEYTQSAILFTTAYADEEFLDRAKEINAIGYLIKPIQADTLLSMIEVGMSRYVPHDLIQNNNPQTIEICSDAVLYIQEQSIKYQSKSVSLSHQETQLLKIFIENPNLLFTAYQLEEILEKISKVKGGALRTTLWRLRKKLPNCITIENTYKSGYKLKLLS